MFVSLYVQHQDYNPKNAIIMVLFRTKRGGIMSQSKEIVTMINNLEKFRTEHNMSQLQFAEAIGMSRSAYTKLVNGETDKLSVDTLKRIYNLTGRLCYQLMEIFTDDYLIIGDLIKDFTPHEMKCMRQFVEVYLETRKRMTDVN